MITIEDGQINDQVNTMWDGLFSKVDSTGNVIQYIQSCLPKNSLCVIPKSDGNINRNINRNKNHYNDVDWAEIQPYINYAKLKNKVFILGTLCQVDEELDCNYLYIPLDDAFFKNGVKNFNTIPWENRSSELCWRGSCSGIGGVESLRVKFVEKIYNYNPTTNVRLSTQWRNGLNIPDHYFDERIDYTEFLKHKIFFIVDGNCIASNHMYGFATGCVPFLISNAKCWFSHLLIPNVHYIPVNYDLSNLIEQIEWVKNNDDKAKQIADNAFKFSEEYFSSEYQHKYIKDSIDRFYKPKIIDCFTFYNEIDLLLYRLTILYDVVDYFIIVEANHTHAGNSKKLYYKDNELFDKFKDKIIHVVVDLPHTSPDYSKNEQWVNENYQRNSIHKGIEQLELNNEDLIIISDLDEIADPFVLLHLKNKNIHNGFKLSQDLYYYNLNTIHMEKWYRSTIVTYSAYTTPQKIRDTTFPIIQKAGWHLSYFGDIEFIKNKIKNYAHQEYNNDTYINNMENKIKNNKDIFDRGTNIKYIDINENNNLPPLYDKYLSKYII